MPLETVDQLVAVALAAFDDPAASTTSHVRRAIRIATKRQDFDALLLLIPETFDFSAGKVNHPGYQLAREGLTALLGPEEMMSHWRSAMARHEQIRRLSRDDDRVYGQSIAQLEAELAQLRDIELSYRRQPPANLASVDAVQVIREYESASAKLVPIRRGLESVIERVKQSTYDFLIETERQIEQGQRRPDIFERGREYIERSLRQRAPDALDKFRAAEEALGSAGSEDLAHALASCRRMIKALADALYPATDQTIVGADGRERVMSDDAYRNRLLQYCTEAVEGSSHRGLVKEVLASLGGRLQRLNELSSKGVHDEVSRTEAETCVMWTYLTAADILRIADGTAPAVKDD